MVSCRDWTTQECRGPLAAADDLPPRQYRQAGHRHDPDLSTPRLNSRFRRMLPNSSRCKSNARTRKTTSGLRPCLVDLSTKAPQLNGAFEKLRTVTATRSHVATDKRPFEEKSRSKEPHQFKADTATEAKSRNITKPQTIKHGRQSTSPRLGKSPRKRNSVTNANRLTKWPRVRTITTCMVIVRRSP